MRNRTGAPVEGGDFFGREKEIGYVWGLIQNGNNILLPSPRRVGKSSFALKMLAKAKEHDWKTIEMNLERVHSEFDFVELLMKKIQDSSKWQKVKEPVAKLLESLKAIKPSVTYEGVSVSFEWRNEKANIYRQLEEILSHNEETLIFFDEVAVLLNSILRANDKAQVEEFLHWLRSLRQISGSKIRWIFSSSVGIENFTSGHQLGKTINDFTRYELKSFTKEAGKAMILALEEGSGIQLNDDIRNKMLDKLGYLLPYFIQILFEKMSSQVDIEEASIDIKLVENSYIMITDGDYLNTWVERLQEQYNDFESDAFLVLRYICKAKDGISRENLTNALYQKYEDIEQTEATLATVIFMLKNDGYLIEEDGMYLFRSPLIRDFWFNRFVR